MLKDYRTNLGYHFSEFCTLRQETSHLAGLLQGRWKTSEIPNSLKGWLACHTQSLFFVRNLETLGGLDSSSV